MKVRVSLAQLYEKEIVANLMRLYRHDLSEFSERETVDSHGLFRRTDSYMSMSEVFVLRGLRRSGVGLLAAKDIIMRYPGCWRIHELGSNLSAQRFWRRVAKEITGGNYVEDDSGDQGLTQIFDIE